jgi:hypothetical protein
MGTITALPFDAARATDWNRFVAGSRNGTFLFDRGFMEYHADRFTDASVMFVAGDRLVGLCPANRAGDALVSHGGLTYGGLVLEDAAGLLDVQAMLEALLAHARGQGCARLVYKTVPWPYHRSATEEDHFLLPRLGARLIRRDPLAMVLPGPARPALARGRAGDLRRARQAGLELQQSSRWDAFWEILTRRLAEGHGIRPVHSLDEITLLASRFPDRIRLLAAFQDGQMLAGAVHFHTDRLVHCQYMAGSAAARGSRALDLVCETAITMATTGGLAYDFGTSTEQGDRVLNAGLQAYKESFGARTVVHDHYEFAL